jgi:hypothetical protein
MVLLIFLFTATFAVKQDDSMPGTVSSPNNITINDLSLTGKSEAFTSQGSLVLSDESPVSVGANGSMKLVSGKSIILLPGTKISGGGFLYATIHRSKGSQSGKTTTLVTVEQKEMIDEQKALEHAATLLSPFASKSDNGFSARKDDDSSISATSVKQYGVTSGNNNKINAITETKSVVNLIFTSNNYLQELNITDFVPETIFVLRL